MKKFPSISSFRVLYNDVKHFWGDTLGKPLPVLSYTGTVKLHGTNCGIRRDCATKELTFQSRERVITFGDDNHGFVAAMKQVPENLVHEMFDRIESMINVDGILASITIYGEWIGPGIHKGVALNQLPSKQFVLFGAYVALKTDEQEETGFRIDAPTITSLEEYNIYNINSIRNYHVEIDFNHPTEAVEQMTALVEQVENECPWGKAFGISGIGEGIVWTCDTDGSSRMWFKTKGEKHSGASKKDKKPLIEVDPQKLETINEVVSAILPEWRLQQGIAYLEENNMTFDQRSTGAYLKWVNQDVLKEEADVIAKNELTWKDISKYVNNRAREYFFDKINSVDP